MKKTLLTLLAALPLAASAQVLRIEIPDTTLQNGANLWVGYTYAPLKFDKKGVFEMDGKDLKNKGMAAVMLKDYSFYRVVLEPGKRQNLKITTKNGKKTVKYSGDNVAMAEFMNKFEDFSPARNWDMEQKQKKKDTISFADAFKKLDADHEVLTKMVGKIKDADDQKTCSKSLLMKYLMNKIALQKDYVKAHKLNAKTDPKLKALMGEIQPNDSDYASYGLVTSLVEYNLPKNESDYKDVTEYGIDYLNSIDKTVSEKKQKAAMLEGFVGRVIDADGMDVEKFWTRAIELCDKASLAKYQFIVDSRKSTKSGMKCPDAEFCDADGKVHHLSEFFGKVLYIDLWTTWCMPCCMEIPYMEKMVEHYKDNDKIQFISISLDQDRNAWLKKIKKDKPAWPQFNANKEQDIALSKQWGISGIPRFLIINADGTINNANAFRPSNENFIKNIDAILK